MEDLKVNIPEGYEIDKENSTFECIKFKKKKSLPTTWEEFLHTLNPCDSYIICRDIKKIEDTILPTKYIAIYKLQLLQNCWREDWKPNWGTRKHAKYAICNIENSVIVVTSYDHQTSLAFKTEKQAKEFVEYFYDLILEAEDLI